MDVANRLGWLLREFKTGHPQWYAELLVAGALHGIIQPTNNPRFDILSPQYRRVEVKSRVDGTDTSQNRSNFGRYREDDFDYAAIVLFTSNYRVQGGVLLPCNSVLQLVRKAGHVKWSDSMEHQDAVDITRKLRRVSGELV